MSAADDSSLDEPLLEEGEDDTTSAHNQNGGVTLHGESVDLRHLFARSGAASNNATQEDNAAEEILGASPTSTLSLDNQSSSTNPNPFTFDYVKGTIMFLPKKGRSLYYRTRYNVASFIQSKRSTSSGGLTPVNSSATSSTILNNDSSHTESNTNNIGCNKQMRNQITQKSSLSSAQSTPILLKFLIPPLLITNHILFYHAQTKPMWNLAYKTNVTISATASTLKSKAAADALNVPHHYDYVNKENKVVETFTYMDAIRKLWKGDGLGDARTTSKVAAALLVIFSGIWPHLKLLLVHLCWFFPFAHRLWLGDRDGSYVVGDEGNKCCNKRCSNHGTKSRCSLCCSNGHSHKTHTVRSPFLRTLSTLGKWSLADVLVVCILIAVLHLDWQVHPDEIRSGIEKELPTLLDYAHSKYPDEVVDCTQLLGYTCGRHALVIHYPACVTCQTLIKNAYHHPEWTTGEGKDILEGITLEGGGYAQLRVMGLIGTYLFCTAVIMSILLGFVVDRMDEKDRACVEEDLLDRKRELEFILPGEETGESGNELELREESISPCQPPQPPLNEAFALDDPSSQSRTRRDRNQSTASRVDAPYARLASNTSMHMPIPSPSTNCYLLKQAIVLILSISSLPLVCYAVALPTMQRLVYGGGPTLLHEVLGMIWEKEYSLISLVKTTGDAGGWDTFLMLTFGLFAVCGPIVRSICLILHVLLGLPLALLGDCIERPRHRSTLRLVMFHATSSLRGTLRPVIDALGAFCCWEVLIVALIMIQLEMPSITDTIYKDERCQEADPEHGSTCIEVQFNALDSFLVVGIAWVVLIVASGLAMDLAGDADEKPHIIGGQEEKRYEFGQSIPHRRPRSNLSRDQAWFGANIGKMMKGQTEAAGNEGNGDEEEQAYYSPLQHQEEGGGQNGLEQIVFV